MHPSASDFRLGLEVLQKRPELAKSWGQCGLLSNQASVDNRFTPAWKVLQEILGKRLVALFGPQHGFEATVQDNMIETGHATHMASGLPVYSLYSETREPQAAMLEKIDTIIIDIQIVGCRVYTFKYSIAACLRAAQKTGKRVVVLDRPNPLGGIVLEGSILEDSCHSFVGEFPIPMRHGLTAAEAARFFNKDIGAQLACISLENWRPEWLWTDCGRPWVLTSPNLPTIDPVYLYPGTVIFEGTNVSEGRGTGLPFQFMGAPYIKDCHAFTHRVLELTGPDSSVFLRPCQFQPTSQKWTGEVCQGLQIHVVEPHKIKSVPLALAILRAAIEMGGSQFAWKQPPYEYNFTTLPIRLILGTPQADAILQSQDFRCNDPIWSKGLATYAEQARGAFLYERTFQF